MQSIAVALATLLLLGLVVLIVSAPLRSARNRAHSGRAQVAEAPAPIGRQPEELETRREAKYQEIRDAELDFRTGKLSREDYEAIDAELRAEALTILNTIEEIEGADRPRGHAGERGGPAAGN